MKIVGIIALYNPTESEIENIRKYVYDLDYCFFMDDSEKDNRKLFDKLVKNLDGKVEYIKNEINIGLVASVNRGIQRAIKKGADWILIMNPDGTFQNDAIKVYRHYIENNDCTDTAMIVPRYNIDRHPKQEGVGAVEVKYADMSGSLLNVSVISQIGDYDANTYFEGLDVEFCLRAQTKGFKIIECSSVVLNHNPGITKKISVLGMDILKYGYASPERYYYQFRSGYYIHLKYHNKKWDLKYLIKLLKVLLLFDNKKSYLLMIKKGISDAKKGYYGKLQKEIECS